MLILQKLNTNRTILYFGLWGMEKHPLKTAGSKKCRIAPFVEKESKQ